MTLLLTRADVEKVLTMKEAIDAVEDGFRQLALGRVTMPQRTAIRIPDHRGLHLAMPAHIGGCGGGWRARHEDRHRLSGQPGAFQASDHDRDAPLERSSKRRALGDHGRGLSDRDADRGRLRRRLQGPRPRGCVDRRRLRRGSDGAHAATRGLRGAEDRSRRRPRSECRGGGEVRRRHVGQPSESRVQAVGDPRSVLEADIVCAASSSKTPVFEGKWLRPGTHLNGVGSHSPDARELDGETIRRSKVVTDHLAGLSGGGRGPDPARSRRGSSGRKRSTRTWARSSPGGSRGAKRPEEITLFKSVGLAVQDAATAARVFDLARAAGVGSEIRI